MTLTIATGRRRVEITKPDKALFPSGETKADLARYYEAVGEVMLPHVAGRPLNLQRFPDGIEAHEVFQQRIPDYFPDWVDRVAVPTEHGSATHAVASNVATLVYLANQACITPHAWLSRADRLERPDRLTVDLDPSGGKPADVRAAARELGALLRDLGLTPFALATGSKGYHVVVPLQRRQGFDAVRAFARDVGRVLVARHPQRFTLEQRKAKRAQRILVDVLRNAYGHTAVAPYALRARRGAPVATPLAWDELDESRTVPDRWTLRTVPRRLRADGDPWRDISRHAGTLGAPRRRLDEVLREVGASSENPSYR